MLVYSPANFGAILVQCSIHNRVEVFSKVTLENMAGFEEKWQKTKSTIKERDIFIFNSDLLSDVSLVVQAPSDENDSKKSKMAIPAHKFVLSICSPVFFAMFYGKMAETSDYINLPDCKYEGVLEMLRYMYSEEVKLNESNVMQVLYVAKKYILPSLADECIDFLHRNVDSANVFCVLSYAQLYDEKSLVDRCWEVIDRETEKAVKSEGFVKIERSLLEAFIKRDSLTIREVELFKAVDLWATKECERQGLAAGGSVKRRILGEEIVKGIRFPAMEEKEFASAVLDCKILTHEEVYELVKNFNGVPAPVGFPEHGRVGTHQSCCRFSVFMHSEEYDGWRYYEDSDYLEFWVDQDVMLSGIRLFGSKDNDYFVSMKIKECHSKKTLFTLEEEKFSSVPLQFKEEKIDIIDVLFDAFPLTKNKHYVVKALIEGPNSCFGAGGFHSVKCHGVTFYFQENKKKKRVDATDVTAGQFSEFFFKTV